MSSILQKIKDSLAKRLIFENEGGDVEPLSPRSYSFKHRLKAMKRNSRIFTREKVSSSALKLRPVVECPSPHITPVKHKISRAGSVTKLPVKGGSLYASHANDKLKACHESIEARRLYKSRKTVTEINLAELIKDIENSPVRLKAKEISKSEKKTIRFTEMKPAKFDINHISNQNQRIKPELLARKSVQLNPNVFLTTLPIPKTRRTKSDRVLESHKISPYTTRLDSLREGCDLELTKTHRSNKLLSTEDNKLQSKFKRLKSFFKKTTSRFEIEEASAQDSIKEFHKQKRAFVYGKDFKGRYVQGFSDVNSKLR